MLIPAFSRDNINISVRETLRAKIKGSRLVLKISKANAVRISNFCNKFPIFSKQRTLNEICTFVANAHQEYEMRIKEIEHPEIDGFAYKARAISLTFQAEYIDSIATMLGKHLISDYSKRAIGNLQTNNMTQSMSWVSIGRFVPNIHHNRLSGTSFSVYPHSDIIKSIEVKINRAIPMLYTLSFILHFNDSIAHKLEALPHDRDDYSFGLNLRHGNINWVTSTYSNSGRSDSIERFLESVSLKIFEYFGFKKCLSSPSRFVGSRTNIFEYTELEGSKKNTAVLREWLECNWFGRGYIEIHRDGTITSQAGNKYEIAIKFDKDHILDLRVNSWIAFSSMYSFFDKIRTDANRQSMSWRKLFERHARRNVMPPKKLLLETSLLASTLNRFKMELFHYEGIITFRHKVATIDHSGEQIDLVERNIRNVKKQIQELCDRISELEASINRFIETRTLYIGARIQTLVMAFTVISIIIGMIQIQLSLEQSAGYKFRTKIGPVISRIIEPIIYSFENFSNNPVPY